MKHFYFAILHSLGFSQKELFKIYEREKNPEIFYKNLNSQTIFEITKSQPRTETILQNIQKIKPESIQKILKENEVNLIIFLDREYPENIKHIFNPPFLLYLRGKIPKEKMLAIIGSRKISPYGKKIISRIVPELGNIFSIVSGGAAGCDIQAHLACLQHNIPTLSIIGTGIDQNYPVTHKKYYEEIVKNGGGILSIFRIGEPGNPYNFPVRNELVAGISEGVIVVEAGEKSGSLITANLALDLGKDVFAFPGDIFYVGSLGTNRLIISGMAQGVLDVSEILQNYNILLKSKSHESKISGLSFQEEKIYSLLLQGNLYLQEMSEKLELSSPELLKNISLLELKGIIKKDISGIYQIS